MWNISGWRKAAAACALGLPIMLTACAGDDSPQNFPPLTYTALSQLHLNVAHIDIVDQAPAGSTPGDISGRAPTPPDQALQEMARDRLVASGEDGNATFTITRATILHEPGGTLQGDMDVHIDVLTPNGQHSGYAQAHVSRTLNPGDQDPESRSVLYSLTSQMMQDMNVELEYQIKKSLSDWLVDAGGAPLNNAVQQQSLTGGPGTAPPTPPASDAATLAPPVDAGVSGTAVEQANAPQPDSGTPTTATPAATPPTTPPAAPSQPDAIFPTGGDDVTPVAAPQVHSPKAGVLQLPHSRN
ncbi:hypothetical protein AA101099_1539 [Neoasaia chiangmaiensis NBRC 101099]|uniref:Uncharacterized protein n=1 Tax=Neoasaia chiangmaiensis TaxID=320497 RepID=A0A1U9KQ29_9PROT|nr:hypothetical protein [Neoasaia chiangmaiensis]AQS87896.1 hypothetical protein A0U93_08035 [Neoasaia chiangmaiensis]GBR39155.1 hypothetical protein AA101099_1539 [Neoasaia chiangmaiensis NBRC 101099]GEN15543.1 hypothetical protein NCH01_19740 [Neoasaia chiangmaiensis]